MEEPKKEDDCPAGVDKKVGDCCCNIIGNKKNQRKEGEKFCSHCYVIN